MSSGTTNDWMETTKQDQKAVQRIVEPDDPLTWDTAWKYNITPWDTAHSGVMPSLKEVMERSGIDFPRSGKALPNLIRHCPSQGYDVFDLASLGLQEVTGMDISETAVDKAYEERNKEPQNVKDHSDFLAANFFEYSNIIFPEDRFFVAIPPCKRNDWGLEMAALIKPGGYLICIVFPIRPPTDTGPPYFVRPEHYDEPLKANFDKVYDQVPTQSCPSHKGMEHVLSARGDANALLNQAPEHPLKFRERSALHFSSQRLADWVQIASLCWARDAYLINGIWCKVRSLCGQILPKDKPYRFRSRNPDV
ncbi:hypothetical protein NMY22_g6366 [Coprinellus aureogranulatus]|nr:hypothetical protein NMY22_g6366 [Coprinellus aureogranulatus]